MIQRITTGWTFVRAFYLIMGGIVLAEAIATTQWIGGIFGLYFAAMGLFGWGCAAGNCYTGNYTINNSQSPADIEFEEITDKKA